MNLPALYAAACATPSDIWEHLPTLAGLVGEVGAATVIELGVRGGNSTLAWLTGLEATGGRLWSVDILRWTCDLADHPTWTFLVGDDLDPAILAQLPLADIVFIDTVHTYDHTRAELDAYRDKLRPGGIFVLHDSELVFEPPEPRQPVKAAIQYHLDRYGGTAEWAANCNGLAVIRT